MNRMISPALLAALLAAGALVACDDSGDNGSNGPPSTTFTPDSTLTAGTGKASYTLPDVCTAFARVMCFQDAVCEYGESTLPSACLQAHEAVCDEAILPSVQQALAAGEAVFDGQLAAKCYNGLKVTCGGVDNPNQAECFAMLKGQVALGEPCATEHACGPAGYCSAPGGQCPGTCTAYSQVGGPCSWSGAGPRCAPGLQCEQEVCMKQATDAPIGQPCPGYDDCVEGAYCDSDSGLCAAKLAEGAPCNEYDACGEGLYCSALGGSGASCVKHIAQGQPCSFGDVCAKGLSCSCPDGSLDCEATASLCRPLLGPGDPCNPTAQEPCGWGPLLCRLSDATCQLPPLVGEPCGEALGLSYCRWSWCDEAAGVCKAPLAAGAPCEDDEQCLTDRCDDGVCVAPPVTCDSSVSF